MAAKDADGHRLLPWPVVRQGVVAGLHNDDLTEESSKQRLIVGPAPVEVSQVPVSWGNLAEPKAREVAEVVN